jgi:hypothetical protein
MARRTATDFINEVRDNAGGETSETLSDARILRFVNEEYKTLCAAWAPQQIKDAETVTTTSGTAAYELAEADILQIEDVFDTTNGLYLRPISEYQYNTWVQGDPAGCTGTPINWFVSGVGANGRFEITFYPTPDGTYSITVGYYEFTELVTSPTATSPVTPIQLDDAIVDRASSRALKQAGNHDSAYKFLLSANEIEAKVRKSIHPTSYLPIKSRSPFRMRM